MSRAVPVHCTYETATNCGQGDYGHDPLHDLHFTHIKGAWGRSNEHIAASKLWLQQGGKRMSDQERDDQRSIIKKIASLLKCGLLAAS
jgi:hypothetical protein